MKAFFRALSILTILPAGQKAHVEGKELARAMAFFPLIGLAIGLVLAGGYYLFSFFLPKSIVLWLTIGLLALLTGGLHLDGFADTLDGLSSGGPKERMLEVMRDSRVGAFGVIGLIFLIGGKYLSLERISDASIPYSLLLMAVMGRNSIGLVCFRSPYARSSEGLAKPFTRNLGYREIAFSLATAFVIAVLLMGWKGMSVFLGTCLFSLGYRFFCIKKLGGVTGDVLGAANEFSELLSLLLLIILS